MTAHDRAYKQQGRIVDYGREFEEEIAILQGMILDSAQLSRRYDARWLAIKLLEQDQAMLAKLHQIPNTDDLLAKASDSAMHLAKVYGDDVEVMIADRRYGFISGLVHEVVERPATDRFTLSDRIDRVVTNRLLGIPIFLLAMSIVFQMTASVSAYYVDWVDSVIGGPVTNWVGSILGWIGLSGTWVQSLLLDGVVAGVGGVLVFLPVLLFLYFSLALLEDSGYMARAAFVMDRLMHALGLHGKSFLPMLLGFGCTVPAIYATRTLENEEDRKLTGFLVPLMSCGARLPVYALFAAAFFPDASGRFIFGMYLLGIVLAVLTGVVMRHTVYKDKPASPFVMELPPYRVPTFRSVWTHMWERSALFVRKATTIILAVAVLLWFLMNMPWGVENPRDSLFGKASAAIAPIFEPAGFGTWEAAGSLATGFVAKEVVVSAMSQIYAGGEEVVESHESPRFFEDVGTIVVGFGQATWDTVKAVISIVPGVDLMGEEAADEQDMFLISALRGVFTPLQAVAFNAFVLIYAPCMVAIAAMRQEFGTRWMLFNTGFLTLLAWVISVAIYQGGMLLGFG